MGLEAEHGAEITYGEGKGEHVVDGAAYQMQHLLGFLARASRGIVFAMW